MSEAKLAQLLAGSFRDPETGLPLSVPTKVVKIAKGLREVLPDLIVAAGLPTPLVVVSDPDTRAAIGDAAIDRLRHATGAEEIVLGSAPHPDMASVQLVRARSASARSLVSVGSGSVTDIVKYAAHMDGKPFVAVATAPSMNGYTSMNAAITVDGHKRTLPATAAHAVLFDLDVLMAAPARMIQAGFADSLARATAQTDWLMAHLLLGTPYREAPFALLSDDEPPLVASAARLVEGDAIAMARLARVLAMSGFGMTLCGGSYPASQGEHLISHLIEMLGDPTRPSSLHGEQVAVATLTMARLQERVLAEATLQVRPLSIDRAGLVAFFGEELAAACAEELVRKALTAEDASALNARLAREWVGIRERLASSLGSSVVILQALREAGAPTTPEAIHVPEPFYDDAVFNARAIRDRFTFLDLAAASIGLDPTQLH